MCKCALPACTACCQRGGVVVVPGSGVGSREGSPLWTLSFCVCVFVGCLDFLCMYVAVPLSSRYTALDTRDVSRDVASSFYRAFFISVLCFFFYLLKVKEEGLRQELNQCVTTKQRARKDVSIFLTLLSCPERRESLVREDVEKKICGSLLCVCCMMKENVCRSMYVCIMIASSHNGGEHKRKDSFCR